MSDPSPDWKARQIEHLLDKALEFVQQGDVSSAFPCWQEVLELDPDNRQAQQALSLADRRRERKVAAEGPADPERIAELLRLAHDHMRTGSVARAFWCWQEVMSLDPGNAAAAQGMRRADRRIGASPGAKETDPDDTAEFIEPPLIVGEPLDEVEEEDADRAEALLEEARQVIEADELESALELLWSAVHCAPTSLEIQGTLELVRAELLVRYSRRISDPSLVARLAVPKEEVTRFNLPVEAGFFLSLVDGTTSVADLMALSGMDAFEAKQLIVRLLDADILILDL